MKALVSTFLMMFMGLIGFTQELKNEIKLNSMYLFNLNKIYPEVSYERSIGSKSAVGIAVGIAIGSKDTFEYVDDLINYDFSVLPYYRHYFGKKRTNGFFVEGNTLIFSKASYIGDGSELGFGMGTGIGAKFTMKNAWSIDFVVGGGYNFQRNRDSRGNGEFVVWQIASFPDLYPRLGVKIGKRF